jgi:predicted DNA-binding transcriptional regulator AlpA
MSDFMDIHEIESEKGVSIHALRRAMTAGTFPKPSHQLGRRRFWLRSEAEKAVADLLTPRPITR